MRADVWRTPPAAELRGGRPSARGSSGETDVGSGGGGGRGGGGGAMLANVALAALTACTAIGFCRIFDGWSYLGSMLLVALGVHACATLLRSLGVPAWLALPVTAAVGFELVAMAFYRDTLRAGIPSGDTVSLLRLDLRLCWEQFPQATAPVPSSGQYVVAVTLALAIAALLADAFAFRAAGRAEAAVPTGVLFVFTAALGTDRDRVAVAALWVGVAVLAVALLRAAHRSTDTAWLGPTHRRGVAQALPAIAACGALAALSSAVIAPRLPGAGAAALLDTDSSDATEVVNPLVDIRSRLVNRSGVQLFTVRSDEAHYWRLTGLPEFDGTTWELPEGTTVPVEGAFGTAGSGDAVLRQRIEITRLGGSLVPAAYSPIAADGAGLAWADDTGTLVTSTDLANGRVVELLSSVIDPGADVLRAATTSSPPDLGALDLPSDFPDVVVELAQQVVAGAPTSYDRALALQNWFRDNFTYDLTVQSGHGEDAIRSFLRIRRGYCEQFAGTFAAMARAVGLPARVAVGFTPGDLQADGRYHVYGRNAHAWPEVWFDDIGWVSFEPTPGRGEPGAEERTGVPPAQDEGSTGDDGTPAPTTTSAPTPTTAPAPATTLAPSTSTPTAVTLAPPAGGSGGGSTGWPVPLALILVAAALGSWVALMPRLVRARSSRRATTPSERVVVAWHGALGALSLAGSPQPAGATPLEYAASPSVEARVDHRPLEELARDLTAAVYAPGAVDEATATRCEGLRSHIEHAARQVTPWRRRLAARLDPRLARRSVGDG